MFSIFPDVISSTGLVDDTSNGGIKAIIKIKGSVVSWMTNSYDLVAPSQPTAALDLDTAAGATKLIIANTLLALGTTAIAFS